MNKEMCGHVKNRVDCTRKRSQFSLTVTRFLFASPIVGNVAFSRLFSIDSARYAALFPSLSLNRSTVSNVEQTDAINLYDFPRFESNGLENKRKNWRYPKHLSFNRAGLETIHCRERRFPIE